MASKLNIHDDRIRTGFEIEGFIVHEDGSPFIGVEESGDFIPAIDFIKNSIVTTLNTDGIAPYIKSSYSAEEHIFHGEIKNPAPMMGWKQALDQLIRLSGLAQDSLRKQNAKIAYQPFMQDHDGVNYVTNFDHLTRRGIELRLEKNWTFENLQQTLVSGFQVNRSIPDRVSDAQQELEFVRELYNVTYAYFEDICAKHNHDSKRISSISDLLESSDSDIYPGNPAIAYKPGVFDSVSSMQEYFEKKSRVSSEIQFDPKNLHSLTIKPKVSQAAIPETISKFVPTFVEWRFFDSFDIHTNHRKVADIMRTIINLEKLVEARVLEPSNFQLQYDLMEHLSSSLEQTGSLAV